VQVKCRMFRIYTCYIPHSVLHKPLCEQILSIYFRARDNQCKQLCQLWYW